MVSSTDKITIAVACELLGISRPTFDVYRKKFAFKETKEGRQVFFSRSEILSKIAPKASATKSLLIDCDATVNELLVDDLTFDLRKIKSIDPHGVLSLLCAVLTKAKEGKLVRLLVEDSFSIQKLHSLGFFHELERDYQGSISWDKSKVTGLRAADADTFLPIQYIGHQGGERKIAEELVRLLIRHGFSEEIGAKIGWIFGELADNAHTHGKGPCYLMCQRFVATETSKYNFLAIAVADMGVGIHKSLKTNPKYEKLGDKTALLIAFKSTVTSWGDEFRRGKGLTDVLAISLSNNSWFRVESGDMGFSLPWNGAAKWHQPMSSVYGTRYSIVLVDAEFKDVGRDDADKYVEELLRIL